MTTARDIMSNLERVGAQETVEAATRKMAELEVDALPICNTDGNLHAMQGMLTDRDIAERVVAEGRDPATTRVGELAPTEMSKVDADTPLDEALTTMEKHDIGRLPVVEGHRIVGIIDHDAVTRALPGAGRASADDALAPGRGEHA